MKKLAIVIYILFCLIAGGSNVASEEVYSELVEHNQIYEIRYYKPVLVAEVEYIGDNGGFGALFNYISGANNLSSPQNNPSSSTKIEMTTPVTRFKQNNRNIMQFFLPKRFTLETAPLPTNPNVSIKLNDGGHFAVIRYSGRASEENFLRHSKLLVERLVLDDIEFLEPAIRAPYNGPFTPPFMRRKEVSSNLYGCDKVYFN